MKRVQLTIAYDGTNYCGWQIQPNGITIEEVLTKTLSDLLKEKIVIIGASRTDSGVHALGNIAVFDTETKIPADKICYALNQRLPEDITIQDSKEVPLHFHPRKCNSTKTYEYKILNRKFRIPSSRLNSYFFYMPLNFEKMEEAAKYLVGEHDFKSFCSIRTKVEDTVRIIYHLHLEKDGDMIKVYISGNGFLYNMVRIIVGTLIKVGLGVYPPKQMEEILDAKDRNASGPKAPANGLTLISLDFEKELPADYHGYNKYWDYKVIYQEIPTKSKGYILINKCDDNLLEELVARVVNQTLRNGAKQVFIIDKEKNRLYNQQTMGLYMLNWSFNLDLLELDLEAWCSNSLDVKALELHFINKEEILTYCGIYNNIFYNVPASATYNPNYVLSCLEQENIEIGFFIKNSEPIGIVELHYNKKDQIVLIDSFGICEQYKNRGYGTQGIIVIIELVKSLGFGKVQMLVATSNLVAYAFYQKLGFSKSKVVSRWYETKDYYQLNKE